MEEGGEKKKQFLLNFLNLFRGVQTSTNIRPAFDQAAINILESNPSQIYSDTSDVKQVFVSVDPAAGGSKSKYAVISSIYVDHKMVVSTRSLSLLVSPTLALIYSTLPVT